MKLFVAKDSDGKIFLYAKNPIRREYRTTEYRFDPNGGDYVEIPELQDGESCELEITVEV